MTVNRDHNQTLPKPFDEIDERLGESWTSENKLHVLEDGDEIFPAMLGAIEGARQSIALLTYVYWDGEIAREFAEALARKAREGVHCQVLLDFHGSLKMDSALLDLMEEAGVVLARYNPFNWRHPLRYQHRTHRKILVCDSSVGFIGGVGIADEWKGSASSPDEWHDFHFRVEGPCVKDLARAFTDNWTSDWTRLRNGEKPGEPIHFDPEMAMPAAESAPGVDSPVKEQVRILPLLSSPKETRSEAGKVYSALLDSAREHVRVTSAFLIPDQEMIDLLCETARRGIRIELVIPGPHHHSSLAQSRSRKRWGDLLECGIEIYRYQPTMCHAKVTIIDEVLATVGSINFDLLSLRLNEEANLIVHSSGFARLMIGKFEKDKDRSNRLTLDEYNARGNWAKSKEWLAGHFPLPWWKDGCDY